MPPRRTVGDAADLDWKFVHANRNAGKDFGNAGVYATPQSIPSLVRETGQNSLDAAAGDSVLFRVSLIELGATCQRRASFLESIRFKSRLQHHIAAAAASGGGTKIGTKLASALKSIEGSAPLRLLRIEDYGARGLNGGEHDSSKPFSALVRDNLNSQKAQRTAGGVFGIGSKTLWACSRFSTVLFSTVVEGDENRGTRVIGKADLAYHEEGQSFSGAGWFGRPVEPDGAESVWPATDAFLESSMLVRKSPRRSISVTGTTAIILGFYDPKADEETGEEIVARFSDALAENFWPAMVRGQLCAEVLHYVDDEKEPRASIEIDPNRRVPEMVDAYRKHLSNELSEKLDKVGDTVSVPIQLTVPASRPGGGVDPTHGQIEAECRLVIRLANPLESTDRRLDHVAYARGRAMVVKYERRSGVITGARPFHAMLLAGTLAGTGRHEEIAEEFLRFAEPTAHDDWSLNGDLKEKYAAGAGARLRELSENVVRALRKYVKTEANASSDGPAILKELFSLKVPKKPVPTANLRLRNVRGIVDGSGWRISGEILIDRTELPFRITPKLSYEAESGKGVSLIWATLESENARSEDQCLVAEAGTRAVRFSGTAKAEGHPPIADRCALRIEASLQPGNGR